MRNIETQTWINIYKSKEIIDVIYLIHIKLTYNSLSKLLLVGLWANETAIHQEWKSMNIEIGA